MKVGTENKKQLYTAGVLGFLALLALYPIYNTLFGESGTPPPQAPPVIHDVTVSGAGNTVTSAGDKSVSAPPGFVVGGQAAKRVGFSDNALDPTLHMEAMLVTESLRYAGSGRNIFGGAAALPPPARPKVEVVKYAARTTPVVQPPVSTGPPPKPPINLKFFGTETNAAGVRRAFLLNGDDVFLAYTGDVVQRRYRVVSISQNSVQVEDIPNDNRQTLPLVN